MEGVIGEGTQEEAIVLTFRPDYGAVLIFVYDTSPAVATLLYLFRLFPFPFYLGVIALSGFCFCVSPSPLHVYP
jgi:hypothetical protein